MPKENLPAGSFTHHRVFTHSSMSEDTQAKCIQLRDAKVNKACKVPIVPSKSYQDSADSMGTGKTTTSNSVCEYAKISHRANAGQNRTQDRFKTKVQCLNGKHKGGTYPRHCKSTTADMHNLACLKQLHYWKTA